MGVGAGHRRDATAGYALLDVMLGLMLIALLAALALPGLARGTGPSSLRVSAFEMSALLREDRNVALQTARPVTSTIDGGALRSGATGASVVAPVGTAFSGPAAIRFMPNGRTTGGEVVIASDRARVVIAVSADTGAIRVFAP